METTFGTESDLEMKRAKPRSLAISLSYRIVRIGRLIFGEKRMLRFFLNGSWLFWRFAFELSGEVYDSEFHNNSKALSEDFLRRWIPENGSVIDVGCGVGRWCRIASKYAGTVVGIDFSEDLILRAKKDTGEDNIEYVVGDVTTQLAGQRFDIALLIHVIEHIEDPDRILMELRSVADKIIVEVPDFENDSLNWVRLRQGCPFYTDADHVREYTFDILKNQLERNGWKVLESRKHGGALLVVGSN